MNSGLSFSYPFRIEVTATDGTKSYFFFIQRNTTVHIGQQVVVVGMVVVDEDGIDILSLFKTPATNLFLLLYGACIEIKRQIRIEQDFSLAGPNLDSIHAKQMPVLALFVETCTDCRIQNSILKITGIILSQDFFRLE